MRADRVNSERGDGMSERFSPYEERWVAFRDRSLEEKLPTFISEGRIFDILFAQQFDRSLLDELCTLTTKIRQTAKNKEGSEWLQRLLLDKKAMLYFVQPSTRTFLSFLNACHILGLKCSEIRDTSTSSEIKGESPEDTIRTFSSYVDIIIMRHPVGGFAEKTAWVLNTSDRPIPVINAGSGADQHPTQALLDIYTLERSFSQIGGIDGKTIVMVGDLLRGRTVRSLSYLMKNYEGVRLVFVAPEAFQMGDDIKSFLDRQEIEYAETTDFESVIPEADAIYMTRIQDEHDAHGESQGAGYERFHFKVEHLDMMAEHAILMHPLPRRAEIEIDVDPDSRAMYWRQERNGMWMRTAILAKIFGREDEIKGF